LWLIAGLGNPGARYARTRHNIGFMVLDQFVAELGLSFREKEEFRICSGSIDDQKVVFVEPLSLMNRSGNAVRKLSDKYSVPPEQIIIVHDDLDLATGRLKIRKQGSSGGHKGIESVIQCLGSRDFLRVKIGIGRDPLVPTEVFVLSKFHKEEIPVIKDSISRAGEALKYIVSYGPDKAMNRYNS
jgi:PTH1 family peptidyl-tRNA hydrolase